MKRNIIGIIFLFSVLTSVVLLIPRWAASAENEYQLFFPLITNKESNDSPFWIQIAALHQISPASLRAAAVMSESEYMALIEEAFPKLVEALVESGAGGTRLYLKWSKIEPDGPVEGEPQYTWDWYDDRLRQIGETGVEIIVTVADNPTWASDTPCSPIYLDRYDEFSRFITDLVNRYKLPPYNVNYWEFVNEPDYTWDNGWSGGLGCLGNNADEYVDMLSVFYPSVINADPEAIVLQGGVAHDWFTEYGGPFNRYFPDNVMEVDGGQYIDVLNFHYFPDFSDEWERWDPNSPDRINGWLEAPTCGDYFDGEGIEYEAGGIDLIAKASHYRNRMEACFGLEHPVWVTELAEHGYANNPESLIQQARYVIQGNVRGLSAGIVNIVWYALATPNDSYEQGLLYDDWTPKPAFYAFKTLSSELGGYEYDHSLEVTDVEGYVFVAPSKPNKTVAWGSGTLTFDPATQLRVVNRDGNVTLVKDGGLGDLDGIQNDIILYQMSDEPVFIHVE